MGSKLKHALNSHTMKLRPTTSDRKAIEAVKKHYAQATATKAILLAVRDVPGMQAEIITMGRTIQSQTDILQKINNGSSIMLGTLEAIKEYCNGLSDQE